MPSTKVATCCYCGTRAALVIDRSRHELACISCGAPLHDLKQMPASRTEAVHHAPRKGAHAGKEMPRRKGGTRKKRKGLGSRIFSEVWDVLEDIID